MALLLKWCSKVLRWYWGHNLPFFIECEWDVNLHKSWGVLFLFLDRSVPNNICENYCVISLWLVVKIFARILLLNWLLDHVAPNILQCGFRPNCGTTDLILTDFKRSVVSSKLINSCFVNLTKAFDTLHNPKLRSIHLKPGCPEKFTGLIRSLQDNRKNWICVNGQL